VRKIWNVISRIDGDQERIAGDHGKPSRRLDLWRRRSNSGTTAMLEAARGFGSLLTRLVPDVRFCFAADGEEQAFWAD
jgi:hypothetical protein